jgi:hypothetical protein
MSISPVSSASAQIQTQQVSAATLQKAQGDGDGRTGVAALNDGDQAAQQAALHATHVGSAVNIKA